MNSPCGRPQSESTTARGGCNSARCKTCYPPGWQPNWWAGVTPEEHAKDQASEAFHAHPAHPLLCDEYQDKYLRPCPCENYTP